MSVERPESRTRTSPRGAPPGRGRLLVLSGPSGAGKTSVARRLLRDPAFERAITATTRPPREGEADGVDYWFLTEEEFQRRVDEGGFLEHARVYGHHYGTPREEPERILASGRHCVLVLDVQGARTLRALGLEARFVYLEAPSDDELARRLRARGLDDPGTIARRLAEARAEAREAASFDQILVNDDLEETARRLAAALGVSLAPPGAERSK